MNAKLPESAILRYPVNVLLIITSRFSTENIANKKTGLAAV